jgi:hypothetical protein
LRLPQSERGAPSLPELPVGILWPDQSKSRAKLRRSKKFLGSTGFVGDSGSKVVIASFCRPFDLNDNLSQTSMGDSSGAFEFERKSETGASLFVTDCGDSQVLATELSLNSSETLTKPPK